MRYNLFFNTESNKKNTSIFQNNSATNTTKNSDKKRTDSNRVEFKGTDPTKGNFSAELVDHTKLFLKDDGKVIAFVISCYTEVFKDGAWKEEWRGFRKPYIINSYDNRHMILTRDNSKNNFEHKARLVSVTEDSNKRVETYDYVFEYGIGHSSPTITIFKSPQKTPDDQRYDILFHFPHGQGDYRYYIQHDDEQMERDKETMQTLKDTKKLIKEILEREEEKERQKN